MSKAMAWSNNVYVAVANAAGFRRRLLLLRPLRPDRLRRPHPGRMRRGGERHPVRSDVGLARSATRASNMQSQNHLFKLLHRGYTGQDQLRRGVTAAWRPARTTSIRSGSTDPDGTREDGGGPHPGDRRHRRVPDRGHPEPEDGGAPLIFGDAGRYRAGPGPAPPSRASWPAPSGPHKSIRTVGRQNGRCATGLARMCQSR